MQEERVFRIRRGRWDRVNSERAVEEGGGGSSVLVDRAVRSQVCVGETRGNRTEFPRTADGVFETKYNVYKIERRRIVQRSKYYGKIQRYMVANSARTVCVWSIT